MLAKSVHQPQETNNKDIKDNVKEHVIPTACGRSVSCIMCLFVLCISSYDLTCHHDWLTLQ